MNITIKPLTPELSDDYFDFFENRAFTDDSPFRCYCQMHQMTKQQEKAAYESADRSDMGRISRQVSATQIDSGVLRGYLAFVDGMAIGWCNANDRASFPTESCTGARFHAPVENKEKALICFEIAPEYRKKGVATALLQRVIDDAIAEGYLAVAAFPVVRDERYEWDCRGPAHMYEKFGFVKVVEQENNVIVMRKALSQS